ncbi:thiol-disulfide oxidoreductase ResA [bacterium BMS3Abin07]|nr:thiol-disulfide oxidoreductase ResA [bacterium BMS3Abin07]GBE32779.1 thiol-disulfide oxidoreductase ResA [bacterium BMS3Bbin05]HDO21568.1 TlpA family protein disulfide reductase [Nitrospirota bacterium]HDZ87240.1 TlpA family protein disulfide reductase [Nitrospirota bacterium]
MNRFYAFITSFLFGIFCFAVIAGAVPPAPWEIDELVGQTAPGFTLKTLDGRDVSPADFRGKILFINFWASWCPPCRQEIPDLNELYEKYKGRGLVIIGVSTDNSESDIIKFVKKYKIKFLIVHDKDNKVMREYKVYSLPISFLIDKHGKVVQKYLGARDWAGRDFLDKIEKLMQDY